MKWAVHVGDCRDHMAAMDPDWVDAICCDPPYGLSFMSKGWDHSVPGPDFWAAALRVAKPGGFLTAFGGTRTYHRLACAIEDAGWGIRDCLQWMYGSGFPKSHGVAQAIDKAHGMPARGAAFSTAGDGAQDMKGNRPGQLGQHEGISDAARQWDGWGTALKPSWEPIILARKPLIGTVAANVQQWGTGGLNIDGCRISAQDKAAFPAGVKSEAESTYGGGAGMYADRARPGDSNPEGRWPANTILGCACDGPHDPGCAVAMLDAQSGVSKSTGGLTVGVGAQDGRVYGFGDQLGTNAGGLGDSGGASRFFYTAKASRAEREAGVSHRAEPGERANTHATVKPISLIRWLVRLTTPQGGLVLDPFNGSGTTGCACAFEGFDYLGIELDPAHVETSKARIAAALEVAGKVTPEDIPDDVTAPVQLGLLR